MTDDLAMQPDQASLGLGGIAVEIVDGDAPGPVIDDKGRLLSVGHADGSIDIYLDSPRLGDVDDEDTEDHLANLAKAIGEAELQRIGLDLIERIEADEDSRNEFKSATSDALQKLGIKREARGSGGTVSTVTHPMLLEAILRFQANATAELLPTDGPCKVRIDDTSPEAGESEEADVLASAVNKYLTTVAAEYYPDTERMLFQVPFTGLGIKKVYRCPLRNRPVSECVEADKIIVAPGAVSIETAPRVTHQFEASPSYVKRMKFVGAWRDVDLGPGGETAKIRSETDEVRDDISGQMTDPSVRVEEEKPYALYETYCELDLPGFEHKDKSGKPTGIPLPYKVTLDAAMGTILEIRRAWRADDTKALPTAHIPYTAYCYIPWSGFYPLGLVHILANTKDALTAVWRILLDLGMFANFPGTLHNKTLNKQESIDLRVQPGQSKGVDVPPNTDIRANIMPLPYTMQGAPALMQLAEMIGAKGERLGSIAETNVGEGRENAPVGTTIALIEQAQQVMASVHKRMHRAQARELMLLKTEIADDVEGFVALLGKTSSPVDAAALRAALANNDLSPQADPNTASHVQRLMRMAAVKQLQQQNPQLYDARAVDVRALRMIGIEDPMSLFSNLPPAGASNPMLEATAKAKVMDAETRRRAQEFKEKDSIAEHAQKAADREVEIQKLKSGIAEKLLANPTVAAHLDQLMIEAARSGAIPGGPLAGLAGGGQ